MNCATGVFTIPCIVLQDLFYCSDTTRSCRPTIAVHLWLRKPFSQKSYSLDWIHAKIKNLIEGCSYCLHVCLCKGKCAIIYVFCRSPNDLIEEKKRLHTYNVYIMTNGRCFQINYVIFHHFFVMERYNARHLSICSQMLR